LVCGAGASFRKRWETMQVLRKSQRLRIMVRDWVTKNWRMVVFYGVPIVNAATVIGDMRQRGLTSSKELFRRVLFIIIGSWAVISSSLAMISIVQCVFFTCPAGYFGPGHYIATCFWLGGFFGSEMYLILVMLPLFCAYLLAMCISRWRKTT
jgi:hypothetical protein